MGLDDIILSIVVPIYNVKPYLKVCLDTVFQAIDSDVEVILVDDGSTDGSYEVAKEYKIKYENVVVLHQPNSGVSSARNYGLKYIRGKFVCFIDSDDKIDSSAFRKCIDILRKSTGEHLFVFSFYEGNDKEGYLKKEYPITEGITRELDRLYMLTVSQKINEPWKKIYLADILKRNAILFPKNMYMGEDICFFVDYLKHVQVYCYVDIAYYYYRKNASSACARVKTGFIEQEYKVFEKLSAFIDDCQLSRSYQKENDRLLLHIVTRDIQGLKRSHVSHSEIKKALITSKVYNTIRNIEYMGIADRIRKQLLMLHMYNVLYVVLNIWKGD